MTANRRGASLGALGALGAFIVLAAIVLAAAAQQVAAEDVASKLPAGLAERLTSAQQRTYLAYREARGAYERASRAYWRKVEARRSARRAKRRLGQAFAADDYVTAFPPQYQGPELPADVAKIVAQVQPTPPERGLPTVADFLAQAKKQFGFAPKRATEREFKRKYAMEALKVGLSKDQVVRVYALETGGLGTYDMQSGIMAAAPGTSARRAAELKTKAGILRKMLRAARSVPNEWKAHQRFATTPSGLGIHALNLDADIGPWMQVLKLKALKDTAARHGYADLTGAEIELMNLAGPGTGLEMMTPLGRNMPTPNFFSEGGYSRNPVVRDKTAAELLAALAARMEVHLKKTGCIEFAQIFDEVAGQTTARR
jgi:hypothetical protein